MARQGRRRPADRAAVGLRAAHGCRGAAGREGVVRALAWPGWEHDRWLFRQDVTAWLVRWQDRYSRLR